MKRKELRAESGIEEGRFGRDLGKMEGMPDRLSGTGGRMGAEYWWVGAMHNGRPVVMGHWNTEEEAMQEGNKKLRNIPFHCYKLPYYGMDNATGIIRKKLLDETGNLESVLARVRRRGFKEGEE